MNSDIKTSGFRYKKSLGQNFIFDKNLLDAIALDSGINDTDTVIEVGVGGATLTRAIATRAKRVIAIEIDLDLKPIINATLNGVNNVEVIYKDILKLTHADILELTDGTDFKVVANLPYYITTPVIFHFLESELPLKSMTLTVQKEVAERMVAEADTEDYGALSLAIASRGKVKLTRVIGRQMFTPAPNVDSAVVRLDIERGYDKTLSKVIRSLFAMRRKTVLNNLSAAFSLPKEKAALILEDAGIPSKARGEQLNLRKVTALKESIIKHLNI